MSETTSTAKQTDSMTGIFLYRHYSYFIYLGQMKKMRIATQIQQEAENMLRTEGVF